MVGGRIAAAGRGLGVGRPVRLGKGSALGVGFAGLLLLTMWASGQASLPTTHQPIHGTIAKLDAPRLHLSLHADDGRRLDLTSVNVDAMRALRTGDHVRVDLDDHGIALNINKTVSIPRPISYSRG